MPAEDNLWLLLKSESETYCDKPAKSKSSTVVNISADNSAGYSSIEGNLNGDVVPLCGRRLFLCERCFNSVTDVVLSVEEAQQCELAEKHYKCHLLVRALFCARWEGLWSVPVTVTVLCGCYLGDTPGF